MPSFQAEVPHQLGQQAARERLDSFLENLRNEFKDQVKNLQGDWDDDKLTFSFRTYGIDIKGTLHVEEEIVKLDGQIPFTAMMFKGKIEQSIRGELEKVLA